MSSWTLAVGDCVEVMRAMESESVDAVVTDPPYGLSFMGKKWDYDVPGVEAFAEMLRVLKPGGRLLCFAGTRTMHRMWVNIEDAGFTIEDTIAWMYGSGFPKHRSKLKPAYEPVCVARKGPVSVLNVDECRINPGEAVRGGGNGAANVGGIMGPKSGVRPLVEPHSAGRWPANVALDEEAARLLDEQTDGLHGRGNKLAETKGSRPGPHVYGDFANVVRPATDFGDSGGASRFFYTAKASRAERGEGNTHPTVKPVELMRWLCRLVAKPGQIVAKEPRATEEPTDPAVLLFRRELAKREKRKAAEKAVIHAKVQEVLARQPSQREKVGIMAPKENAA